MLGLAPLLLLVCCVPSACSDSEQPKTAKLAAGCTLNTDCDSPLVCAFQRCHSACETSRDCDPGQRCMASDRPFHVCQLAQEQACSYNSQCPDGQVCGADGQCRDQCASDRDCVTGQLCKKGNCADATELDDAGNLPIPDAGKADAGREPRVSRACTTRSAASR